tara:strand:- start:3225 stop:4034 length:810 start_codon:yes stop_codon:yes gene_type:complete
MNYNLIYDPISKKYKDIYSKSGKLIIKKYLDYLIGGTSQDDIPLNTYKSLKELSISDFREQIEKLYSDAKTLQVKSFHEDDVDKILNSLFGIKRISAPGNTVLHNRGGIFIDKDDNIIKMTTCRDDNPTAKSIYFKKEAYWMVNLYRVGISPEFKSIDFIKLELDGDVNLYGLVTLKKHKTFRDFYNESFDDSELRNIKDNIMGNEMILKMFTDLLDKANTLDLYVMEDFHLNNLVMNCTNGGLLLIDTMASIQKGGGNTLNEVEWKFL